MGTQETIHSQPKDSDLTLAMRLRNRDNDALSELYDLYGTLCYSVAFRIIKDPSRAEDAVQEGFLKAWKKVETLDLEKGSLRSWLVTIVRNKAIDSLRGKSGQAQNVRYLHENIAASNNDPFEEVFKQLEKERVHRALESLSPPQREVIMMGYFEGLKMSEMSNRLELPLSTIKGRMRCAMKNIDSYLRERR